jgi:O-antigen biosynthesis protein
MNMSPRSKPLRIAMIPSANGGVNYYRLATWAFQMRKYKNVEAALFAFQYAMLEPHPWQRDMMSILEVKDHIESLCKAADVVIWQPVYYEQSMEFFNEMRQKYGKYTIVETDDDLIDVPAWNEAFHSFNPNSYHRKIALECMSMADGMIVSTPHLQNLYGKFNTNIHVVENSLDFKGDSGFVGWDKVSPKKHKGTRIGWIGGRSHFNDLMMVAPVLSEFLMRRPDVDLYLVNSALRESCVALGRKYPFDGLKNVYVAERSVHINRYAQFAAHFGFDIGIAPLIDCNFNRAKSNLRWLEYSALGIPTIATDISHFSQTIRKGEDGILIPGNDLNQWDTALNALVDSRSLRENMGRMANKRVKRDFNVARNAAKYIRLLKSLLNTTIMGDEVEEKQYATV